MSRIPTIRVKSTNPEHHEGFFLRNADDLRYGEELFMAKEFERIGEHAVRLKIANLSSDDQYRIEADVWLRLIESSQKRRDDCGDHWYKKPIGILALSATAGVLAYLVKYLL